MAQPFDRLVQRSPVEMEGEQNFSLVAFDHVGVERSKQTGHAFGGLAEADAIAGSKPLGGLGQSAPEVRPLALDQCRFDARDGVAAHAHAVEARGDDARIVDDKRVAGAQVRGEIADDAVFKRIGPNHQHARAVARLGWPERDALLRKIKIEEVYAHFSLSPCAGRGPG